MPPNPGPSWRGAADKSAPSGSRSWRKPGSGLALAWNPKSRWLKTITSLTSLLMAICLFVLFIVLLWMPGCNQQTFEVVAPDTTENPEIPPHPFVASDADAFATRMKVKNPTSLASIRSSTSTDSKAGAKKRANRVKPSSKTRTIYVSALSGQLEEGIVLYDKAAIPDDTEANDYLPLTKLWDYLRAMPAEHSKLLIIDLAAGPIDWRWGQFVRPQLGFTSSENLPIGLPNDVFSSDPTIGIPNLAILTSVAPGETSWSSSIRKHSVFSDSVIRALAGEADKKPVGNDDKRISLKELYNFVLNQTNRWVELNRDPRGQHPQLLLSPENRDEMLKVVVSEIGGQSGSSAGKASGSSPAGESGPVDGLASMKRRIEELWTARDEWNENEKAAVQWHPLAWRQFLEDLRRAEQWWLAGQPEATGRHLEAATIAVQELEKQFKEQNEEILGQLNSTPLVSRKKSMAFANRGTMVPEDHLKEVLVKYAPRNMPQDLVDQSYRLSRSAEEQSWRGYRSRSWVGANLDQADQARRESEDLLFVGGDEIERSKAARQAAEGRFQNLKSTIDDLSEVVRLHNRLLAELPELAWWASQRVPVESISRPPQESARFKTLGQYAEWIGDLRFRPPSLEQQANLLNPERNDANESHRLEIQVLLLIDQTRQLGRLLDRERDFATQKNNDVQERNDWRGKLNDLKQSLTKEFESVASRLKNRADDLAALAPGENANADGARQGQTQVTHWLNLRNSLYWSGLPKTTRDNLFRALAATEQSLSGRSQTAYDAKLPSWNGEDWSNVDGGWQSLWALQVLSLGMPDTEMDRLWVDWKDAFLNKSRHKLAALGASVRAKYRERDRIAKTEKPIESDSLENAFRTLLVAERAARTLHGYDAVHFALSNDPVRSLREFDQQALCIVQARRYLDDFWSDKSGEAPWFAEVVNQSLRSVGENLGSPGAGALKAARRETEKQSGERRKAVLKIAKLDQKTIDLSLRNENSTSIAIEMDNGVPDGTAAVWFEYESNGPEPILKFVPEGRQSADRKISKREFALKKNPDASGSGCEAISLRPKLLFRGRFWNSDDSQVNVDPCPPKSIKRHYSPSPVTGEIVVYGVDRRDTIFMLDCSLSMNDKSKKSGLRRFDDASKALVDVLKQLNAAPSNPNAWEPYRVGLCAFGHRLRARNRNPETTQVNEDWPLAKLSFDKQTDLAKDAKDTRNWMRDCELLEPPKPLVDEHFSRMLAHLDPDPKRRLSGVPILQPYGETPLLTSVRVVARYLADRDTGGRLIVVCDGEFNDGETGKSLYNSVKTELSQYNNVQLDLVAFDLSDKAQVASLKNLANDTGAKFEDAATTQKLAETALEAFAPRPYKVLGTGHDEKTALRDVVKNLEPGTYQVQFPNVLDFPAVIAGGERLVFDLSTSAKTFIHQRREFKKPERARANSPATNNDPTIFGYLEANYDKPSRVATLKFGLNRDGTSGMVERPKEIRIEVWPSGGPRRWFSGSSGLLVGQSIPAWEMTLNEWPEKAKPEVKAFWKMSRTEVVDPLPIQPLMIAERSIEIEEWPSNSLTVAAELRGSKLLVKLKAVKSPLGRSVADIRVEIGRLSLVTGRFQPDDFQWTSELYDERQYVIYSFEVGNDIDLTKILVGLTPPAALERDAIKIESPLQIDKWDDEL